MSAYKKYKVIRIPYVEKIKAEWNPGYKPVEIPHGVVKATTLEMAKIILQLEIESGKFPEDAELKE